jgi:RNA ligase
VNYKFPIIKHMNDVLPAIEGRPEFIVATRPGFFVINYNVGFEDTFTIDPDDVMENNGEMIPKGVMRRECRGLIFDAAGNIMSRPFHKFFNIGEREETQPHVVALDMMFDHIVMEKMDGSMIRPLEVNGVFRLGTKMGVTDTSDAAEKIMTGNQKAWMKIMMEQGVTPIFEFISPDNRIVIKYDQPELVLLAIRNNITGEYIDIEFMRGNEFFRVVDTYGAVNGNLDEYIARQRGLDGREGDIIRFANGHMLKVKNDWYVRIHKVKDQIRTDRHILKLLINNELDDAYPHFDEVDYIRVKKYEHDFHEAISRKIAVITHAAVAAWRDADGNKKDLATRVLPNSDIDKADWQYAFKYADGKDDFYAMVMDKVASSLGNTAKYNDLAAWLGISADNEEDE